MLCQRRNPRDGRTLDRRLQIIIVREIKFKFKADKLFVHPNLYILVPYLFTSLTDLHIIRII